MAKDQTKPESGISIVWIAVIIVLLSVAAFVFLRAKEESHAPNAASVKPLAADHPEPSIPAQANESVSAPSSSDHAFRMPPYLENTAPFSLLPTLDPDAVSPAARDGYKVAQNKPELLAQLPCFCYCDRFGHGSLHDCFASNHAEGCDICLKEALEADQMDRQATPVQDIRAFIVEKYHPRTNP